jgi:pimeloyl-ACP methyl ester carboxylesterase
MRPRYGNGPTVILVAGALGARKFKEMEELAELLAERCTVINYDRRGRGDSTDVKPFAVEREIEDLAALIDACGGSASLWGWSSGGALALRAVAAGTGSRSCLFTRCRSWSSRVSSGRRPTTASGSTSWSRPTIEAAR